MSSRKFAMPPLRRSASATIENGRLSLTTGKIVSDEQRLVDVVDTNRFTAVQGSTIQCRRVLASLLSDREDRHVREKLIPKKHLPKTSSEEETSSDSEEEESEGCPLLLERKASWQMPEKFDDKCAKKWNWPLPHEPKIQNEENQFEVELVIAPYNPEEIWVRAVGSDLVMRFAKTDDHELQRTYQLPINVDPKSIRFAMSKSNRVLRISANKISPIKFMAAAYGGMSPADKAAISAFDVGALTLQAGKAA